MVTPRGVRRKAAFRAALALAGMTQGEWAKANGYSLGHLSEFLHEKRQSAVLAAKIDAFVKDNRRPTIAPASDTERAA